MAIMLLRVEGIINKHLEGKWTGHKTDQDNIIVLEIIYIKN